MVTTAEHPPEPAAPAAELVPAAQRGVAAMQAINFRISGDTVHKATEALPEAERESLRWFASYCRTHNLTKEKVAALLKKPNSHDTYSWDAIYQTLTGRRADAGVSIAPIVQAIAAFRRIAEEREGMVTSGFIETRLFTLIEQRCERARLRQKIGFIFGDGQIGKSDCLQEVQRRHNHGQTYYVEMPAIGTLTSFLDALGAPDKLDIGRMNNSSRARRIIECFDDSMLLIVDEFHRCLSRRLGSHGLQVASFIRELFNRRKCGVMLCMTNEGRDAIAKGENRKTLEQLWRRRIQPLQLPNAPFIDDLDRFAIAYGLEPAPDQTIKIKATALDERGEDRLEDYADNPRRLQAEVSAREGLGVWLTILQDASDMARASKRAITWGAVLKAYTLSQMEAVEVR